MFVRPSKYHYEIAGAHRKSAKISAKARSGSSSTVGYKMKTSCLRNSRNYIWNINNVLGKGATGSVYSGLNKMTGESVAVKSFNHASQMRPYELQEREFEVLKKVNHQNIVKLLAIEEEVRTGLYKHGHLCVLKFNYLLL